MITIPQGNPCGIFLLRPEEKSNGKGHKKAAPLEPLYSLRFYHIKEG
jgi:hypothetical protein